MKIFLDTADIEEIRTVARWGVLDGVTTNPTLFAKTGGMTYEEVLKEICSITSGPVSAEVVAEDVDGMLKEGRAFAKLAPNIVVKVPMSEEGLEAMSRFADEGIKTNCTLIFTANQGLLAAKAGASLLSPFVGRLDDINQDGMIVIRELAEIVAIHELETEVLAASIRNPRPHDPGGAGGRARGDPAVQGPQADGPPPADRQRHHPVPVRLGEGPRGARGTGRRREEGSRGHGGQARRVTRAAGRCRASGRAIIDDRTRSAVSSRQDRSEEQPVAATEEILGQFLGDEAFPVTWESDIEKDFFWVYDDLHCPHPVSPMFFDIGGWWLSCDHMFRRFGTPFAVDWLAKNVNGYVYTTAIPADPDIRIEGTEYSSRYGARVPRDASFAATWAPTSTPSCPSMASISPTGGTTGSCPRCSATSRRSRSASTPPPGCRSPRWRCCSRTRSTCTIATGRSTGCSTSPSCRRR